MRWSVWKRPDVPLDRVLTVGLYLRTPDMPVRAGWEAACAGLLQDCKAFHEKELTGSRMEWALCGPLELPFSSDHHSGDANAYYHATAQFVQAAASKGIPMPVQTSKDYNSMDCPTMVCFVNFGDWGLEKAGGGNLDKYFVALACKSKPEMMDKVKKAVSLCGGSRSTFWGKMRRSKMAGVPHPSLAAAAAGSGSSTGAGAGGSSASAAITSPALLAALGLGTADFVELDPEIGYGVGLVTQEAWVVPEVPGCDAVTYHEGLGHALGMPHPTARQRFCVMDQGMYQQVHIRDLCVCEEIKADMRLGEGKEGARKGKPLSWVSVPVAEVLEEAGKAGLQVAGSSSSSSLRGAGKAGGVALNTAEGGALLQKVVERSVTRSSLQQHVLKGASAGSSSSSSISAGVAFICGRKPTDGKAEVAFFMRKAPVGLQAGGWAAAGAGGAAAAATAPPASSSSAFSAQPKPSISSDGTWQLSALLAAAAAGSPALHWMKELKSGSTYSLAAEWQETQLIQQVEGPEGASSGLSFAPYNTFAFKEVAWEEGKGKGSLAVLKGEAAAALVPAISSAAGPAAPFVLLFDKDRNIAICLLQGVGYLSSKGLWGRYFRQWESGEWLAAGL